MGINIKKKYYIIPVVYIGIISLLIYMQFSTTSEFTDNISAIQITGETRASSTDRATAVTSLQINIHGFILPLSSKTPIIITTLDDNKTRLFVKGYTKTDSGMEIYLTDNIRLRIDISGKEAKEFRITAVFPSGNQSIKSATLNYRLLNPEDLSASNTFPVFSFSEGGRFFFTSASPGSEVDSREGKIRVLPDSESNICISVKEAEKGIADPYSYWFSRSMIDKDTSDSEAVISEFIDKGYSGWKISRFNRQTGKWKTHDGLEVYNSEVISALASESFKRNEFRLNSWLFNASRVINKDTHLLEASLANGNLINTYAEFQKQDVELINRISSLIKGQDTSVFLIKDLIKIIVDRGPYSLTQELFQMAESSYEKADREIKLGIAKAYLDFTALNIEPELSLKRFNSIIDNLVLSHIVKTEKGLFIAGPSETSDTVFTLNAADCLISSSEYSDRPVISTIGKKLITTLLQFSNSEGFIPEKIILKNNEVRNTVGFVEPETVYPYLNEYKYIPRIISLKNELSPGAWIATCAENVEIKNMPGEIKIKTAFPAGSVEYIIIQGVSSVSGFQLYGKDWVSDVSFERYSAGWVYQSDTKTALIKLLHKTETEEITIKY